MTLGNELLDSIKITPLMDTLCLKKINDDEYFSSIYSDYISNSRLSLINPEQDNDPNAFFEGLGKHNKYSDALIFGSAVHELTLQPELFELCNEVDRPTAKVGFMADELWKNYCNKGVLEIEDIIRASNKIGYYKGKLNDKIVDNLINRCMEYYKQRENYESFGIYKEPIYLDPKSRERVEECVRALRNNKDIYNLLHPSGLLVDPISENEQAILLNLKIDMPLHDPFIFKIKAKLDQYTIDNEINTLIVNDVKTIGKVVSEFSNNFEKFHYYRELALYSWLLSLVASKEYNMKQPTIKSNCLVVSTIPKYYTKVYKLTRADFIKGWVEFIYLIKLAAYYYSKGYRF